MVIYDILYLLINLKKYIGHVGKIGKKVVRKGGIGVVIWCLSFYPLPLGKIDVQTRRLPVHGLPVQTEKNFAPFLGVVYRRTFGVY